MVDEEWRPDFLDIVNWAKSPDERAIFVSDPKLRDVARGGGPLYERHQIGHAGQVDPCLPKLRLSRETHQHEVSPKACAVDDEAFAITPVLPTRPRILSEDYRLAVIGEDRRSNPLSTAHQFLGRCIGLPDFGQVELREAVTIGQEEDFRSVGRQNGAVVFGSTEERRDARAARGIPALLGVGEDRRLGRDIGPTGDSMLWTLHTAAHPRRQRERPNERRAPDRVADVRWGLMTSGHRLLAKVPTRPDRGTNAPTLSSRKLACSALTRHGLGCTSPVHAWRDPHGDGFAHSERRRFLPWTGAACCKRCLVDRVFHCRGSRRDEEAKGQVR